MKKTSTILAIGSALALGSAQAEIESSFHVGYSTDYVWRGLDQGPGTDGGLYEYGIDFTGDSTCGISWNAGVWVADYADGFGEETDIYGSLSKEFGAVELSLGLIRYDFGQTGLDSTEIFLGLGTEFNGFSVGAVVYYDVDQADGAMFGELSVGQSFDVGGATVEIGAHFATTLDAGSVSDPYGNAGENYVTYGLSAAVSKELGDHLTGTVYVSAEKTEGHPDDGDDLFGGASLSYSF